MDNGISDYRKVIPRIKMNYDGLNFLIIKNSRWPILHVTDILCKTHASVNFLVLTSITERSQIMGMNIGSADLDVQG